MSKRPTHAFPEVKRKAGKLGRQNSPWTQGPNCCTPKAAESFRKGQRLHLIRQIAEKKKEAPDEH